MKILLNVLKLVLNIFKFISILTILLILICLVIIAIISSDPMDGCMDVGYCKEGLPLNIEGKKITVNKQTCLENNGKWLEDRKVCQFRWN